MSAEGVSKFIGIIAVYFPKPRFEDPETDEVIWQKSLTRMIGHYDDDVLAKAADTIVRTRRKRDGAFFPLPEECITACENAKRVVECAKVPLLSGPKAPSGFSPERHKLALDLMGTELGREAYEGRWHGALYDFIYAYGQMPKGTQIDHLKRRAAAFNEAVRACETGSAGELSPRLAKLGRYVRQRRDGYAKTATE